MAEQLDYAEQVIAMVARSLKRQNHQRELTILVKAKPTIEWVDTQYGIELGELHLTLPIDIYEQIEQDREVIQNKVKQIANEVISSQKNYFERVYLSPRLADISPNWREEITTLSDSQFGIPPIDSQYEADVFMVMPFKDKIREEVYRDHVAKRIMGLDLTIKRGDDFFSQNSIMQDIWGAINAADIIIADCTGRNPNVFYELGIAHTLGKRTIMITENEDDIPFDLRHLRYVKYEFTPRGMSNFETDLIEIVNILSTRIKRRDDIDSIPF